MYNIGQLKEAIKGKWHIYNNNAQVKYILNDSRKLLEAKYTLFFAIEGKLADGHDYINELYNKGVRNFVVEKEQHIKPLEKANFVFVKDSLKALQNTAIFHRNHFKIPVVGITGSNGKTIVKEWCHQLLQDDYTICRSPKSYNSQLGVALSVWGLKEEDNLALFEAGISESNEMENLEKMIQPNIGIFTTLGSAHSENFINLKQKAKEKLKLFINAEVLIYNSDVSLLNHVIIEAFGHKTIFQKSPSLLSWGKSEHATLQVINTEKLDLHILQHIKYKKKTYHVKLPYSDSSTVQNIMHCVALMLYLGYNEETINHRLLKLQRIEMRLEQKNGINNCILINDSYNSDIDSLKIAIDFLNQQRKREDITVILSDILQSGMTGVNLYSAVNELLIHNNIDRFIAIGKQLEQHKFLFKLADFKNGLSFYPDTTSFLNNILDNDFKNEIILLKGARSFEFERISASLEEKAHATVLEIDLNALLHNYRTFAAYLKPKVKIMAMVKAFSYGASSVEIAKFLEFNRVDYLGVAYADEGILLRKAGIQTPIMVLNPEKRSFNAMIKYNIEPEMYSFTLLHDFINAVKEYQYNDAFPIHINLETGMNRLGFEEKDLANLTYILNETTHVKAQTIYSHLAASDEPTLDSFTLQQIAQFEKLSRNLMDGISYHPMRHLLNSNGIIRFPQAQYDMVRLGIGMYGYNEILQDQLQNVTRLKTTISQIKHIPKGETIGYGRKGLAKKDLKIATIAIGYADGLNRLLSNGVGEVYVRNNRAPIIGNICMDMTMIDVTNINGVKEGDVVEIFGDHISANEIAEKLNTIQYEVLCNVSERVKRVFFVDSQ